MATNEKEAVCKWLPIETSPIDGEDHPIPALIAYEDGHVIYDDEYCRGGQNPREPYNPEITDIGIRPTHWMPIPKAPFVHPSFIKSE